MRITLRRVVCLVAVATAPLTACEPLESTMPRLEPAAASAHTNVQVVRVGGDTLRSCPEVRIPEMACLDSDLPHR